MYKIMVELSGGIDSRELYNMVANYELNVTDIVTDVYMHGKIHSYELCDVLAICEKFGITAIYVSEVE